MSSSDSPPPFSGGLPVASDEILMLSLPDTQDAGNPPAVADVFHTPPEESSLPSSDVDFCDAPEAVDLGKGSQLGFSEVQAEGTCGVGGDDSGVQREQAKEGVNKGKEKVVSENDGVVEVNKGTGVEGGSEGRKRVLPPSVRGGEENVASEGDGARKIDVFDVFRVLATPRHGVEDDNNPNDNNPNLMDDVRALGIEFPRPRWYPKGYNP